MDWIPGDLTKVAVVAIGGNVLAPPQRLPSWEQQVSAARGLAPHILKLRDKGFRLVLTHGNGPQVGAILLQNEVASASVPPSPLDVCVAQSQALIGYSLQLALLEELRRRGIRETVTPLVTMVVVDHEDEAFSRPSKPIGPLYRGDKVIELRARGWTLAEDSRGGHRRVVASPKPQEVLGAEQLRSTLERDAAIVIVAGGGGIPVVRGPNGLEGVEAVVDKDLSSGLLASRLEAKLLVMITDVPCVYLRFGAEDREPLRRMSVEEAAAHLKAGEFPPGSMGPKVLAAVEFLRGADDARVIITDAQNIEAALEGEAGTTILP